MKSKDNCDIITNAILQFSFLLIVIAFIFYVICNYYFESHWDEVSLLNLSCEKINAENCREKNGISVISNVYTKNTFSPNGIILRARSNNATRDIEIISDDRSVMSKYRLKKKSV